MTRILWVELRRFAWRRSFRLFGLLALAGIAFAAVIVFVKSDPTPPTGFGIDNRFHLTLLTDIFAGTSIPLIILGLAFGASFIGAEWHTGAMTTMLTWEPRRVRVMLGKVIALIVAVFLSGVAIQAVLGLALVPAAALQGTTEGVDGAWFVETAAVVARGALVAGLLAALGFAIASLARNTTTSLIIGFVYFAVAEGIIRGLRPKWQPWLIGDNAAAFVTAEPNEVFIAGQGHGVLGSFLVLAIYAFALWAIATAWFKARDVT